MRIIRKSAHYRMEIRISATELARSLGDVLGRIRYLGDVFLVERNGEPVARLTPLVDRSTASLAEALAAWREAGDPEPEFADALEAIGAEDRPPPERWGS